MVRQRVRMRFCKQGDLRLIGHRDLMRCLERLFRRAGLPLAMSQGFHPKPRMTFPSALALGIEGVDEVLELELTESPPAEELLQRLTPHAPPGAWAEVGRSPPGRRQEGPGPQLLLPGADPRAAPRRPGGEDRPPDGRFELPNPTSQSAYNRRSAPPLGGAVGRGRGA